MSCRRSNLPRGYGLPLQRRGVQVQDRRHSVASRRVDGQDPLALLHEVQRDSRGAANANWTASLPGAASIVFRLSHRGTLSPI